MPGDGPIPTAVRDPGSIRKDTTSGPGGGTASRATETTSSAKRLLQLRQLRLVDDDARQQARRDPDLLLRGAADQEVMAVGQLLAVAQPALQHHVARFVQHLVL